MHPLKAAGTLVLSCLLTGGGVLGVREAVGRIDRHYIGKGQPFSGETLDTTLRDLDGDGWSERLRIQKYEDVYSFEIQRHRNGAEFLLGMEEFGPAEIVGYGMREPDKKYLLHSYDEDLDGDPDVLLLRYSPKDPETMEFLFFRNEDGTLAVSNEFVRPPAWHYEA